MEARLLLGRAAHVRAGRALPRRRGGHQPGARPRPGSRRRRPPGRGPHCAQPPPLARGPLRRGDRPGRGGRRRAGVPAGPGSSRASSTRPGPPRSGSGAGRMRSACSSSALEEAVAAGDRLGEAYALHGLGEAFASPARRPPRSSTATAASALLRELGHRSLLYENEYILALALLQAGRIDEADALAEGAIEGCRAIGDRRNLAFALATAAQTALPRLDLDRADGELAAGGRAGGGASGAEGRDGVPPLPGRRADRPRRHRGDGSGSGRRAAPLRDADEVLRSSAARGARLGRAPARRRRPGADECFARARAMEDGGNAHRDGRGSHRASRLVRRRRRRPGRVRRSLAAPGGRRRRGRDAWLGRLCRRGGGDAPRRRRGRRLPRRRAPPQRRRAIAGLPSTCGRSRPEPPRRYRPSHVDAGGVPDVPPLRGHLRSPARARGRPRDADPRGRGRRLLTRLHLPEGIDARSAPRRSRPTPPTARAPRRRASSRSTGTRRSPRSSAGSQPILAERRPRRRRDLHRQPERAQLRQHDRDPPAREGARHEERLHGLHRRPDAEARRLRARLRASPRDPRSRHRPHRLPAPARCEPARVERQPRDGAGLAGPARGDPAPRRPCRRRRPAADADGGARRTCTSRSARARTLPCSRGSRTRSSRRGSPTSGALAQLVAGSTTCARRSRSSRPSGSRRSPASRPRPCSALARDLAAAPTAVVYGRIGTHTTAYGTLAAWLVDVLNALTGNLDRPGGAMFPHPAHEKERRKTRAFRTRSLDEPRARPARGDGRAPGVDARGRDRDAGRRPGARAR